MTINEIRYLLKQCGIKPSKAKGQNFLIDQNILKNIIAAADLKKEDYVLEIGPGFGILTQELIKTCKKILAVELDKRLLFFLKQKFKNFKNLELLEGDILKIKNEEIVKKLEGAKNYKVVANLPYSITKPVLRKFLTYKPKPKEIVVLVQKEVAQKIVAKPGQLSLLSLFVQFYGQPEILGYVSKQSFYPQPKVESAILKIKLWSQFFAPEVREILGKTFKFDEKKFWQLVKIGYSSPRKQLQNNLKAGYKMSKERIKEIIKSADLAEKVRAEEVSLKNWLRFYKHFLVFCGLMVNFMI